MSDRDPSHAACRSSSALDDTYFQCKINFFSGGPIIVLKRNVKRSCWLQTYTFPMKNQQFQQKITISIPNFLGRSGGDKCFPCSVAFVSFKNFASHAAWRGFWAAGVALGELQESSQRTPPKDASKDAPKDSSKGRFQGKCRKHVDKMVLDILIKQTPTLLRFPATNHGHEERP